MNENMLGPLELDAIGEIMNISLGSSATALSQLLDKRVEISVPDVSVITSDQLEPEQIEDALGVEINYEEGLEGVNMILLKPHDIEAVDHVVSGQLHTLDELAISDMTMSAIGEIMNQMMGAAATAMADFLNTKVSISTPSSFKLSDFDKFKKEKLPAEEEPIVVGRFDVNAEDVFSSDFICIITLKQAKELIKNYVPDESNQAKNRLWDKSQQEEAPAPQSAGSDFTPENMVKSEKVTQEGIKHMADEYRYSEELADSGQTLYQKPDIQAEAPQPEPAVQRDYPGPAMQNAAPAQRPYYDPKLIQSQPVELPEMNLSDVIGKEQAQNLDLIMEVPVQVTVEIGRTTRKVQDVLEFTKGSLVVLNKLAGDQVDLFVNGKCIAKGDVVVVDDNFGVRITEILQNPANVKPLKK